MLGVHSPSLRRKYPPRTICNYLVSSARQRSLTSNHCGFASVFYLIKKLNVVSGYPQRVDFRHFIGWHRWNNFSKNCKCIVQLLENIRPIKFAQLVRSPFISSIYSFNLALKASSIAPFSQLLLPPFLLFTACPLKCGCLLANSPMHHYSNP